jgi:exopolyphosphatase/guanosine-5'-triphosphate,3'-diphosphate pyrophosphatase
MTVKQRRNVAGLNADRADIIVAGLAIVDRLMRHLKVNDVQVHHGGVRDGLLWSMVQQLQPPEVESHDQLSAIRQFAESCGADWTHSRHVALLARQILDDLMEPYHLRAEDRKILETAAMLQDVGYLINYDQHHKHSYHLIVNSRLLGFTRRELELIANVARYHRGANPKRKHENFRRLSAQDQQRVRHLAAILRLAGGLDRSHTQQIQAVRTHVNNGQTVLSISAKGDAEVDIWAARRRAASFEKVFQTELTIAPAMSSKTR